MRDIDLDTYLGMEIHRDRAKGVLTLCQTTYTRKMLESYGFTSGPVVKTPMDSKTVFTVNDGQADEDTIKDYQAKIGSLLFLAIHTRADILYAVVTLSRFMTNPSPIHIAAVKRIFRYLRIYPDMRIPYLRDGGDQLKSYTNAN